MNKKNRAFLKWAGGKFSLCDAINKTLPSGKRLVEPFVGAGSVFLNSDYEQYLLNDINQDLINLYKILQQKPLKFIADAKEYFTPEHYQKEVYLKLRADFNSSSDPYFRSLVFLYMNRHGFNGLCRYNKSGGYNVPFGKFKTIYFPEAELNYFAEKSQRAVFTCQSYRDIFKLAESGDVFYCDPPYVPLSKSANFTSYAGNGFGLDQQADLANAAEEVIKNKQVSVLISNHDTIWTRKIYAKAKQIESLPVKRTISAKGHKREKVAELLALYK